MLSLLIVQLSFSQTDTTNSYPKLVYPKYIVEDTVVLFTPYQTKLIKIDAINADSYKRQLDTSKHIIEEHQKFINLKNEELKAKDFEISIRKDLLANHSVKDSLQSLQIKTLSKQLKNSQLGQKITIPLLGLAVISFLTTIMLIK